mmetsp:Transcript_1825/g.5788  ORF Transcript_1825/g.5788 Transcript_1825/m.5788 type:complete len:244 (+) Transcript_1825:103-834(+)
MGQLCEHCGCDAESVRQERLLEQTELDARLAERLQAEEFRLHAAEAVRRRPSGDAAAGPTLSLAGIRPQRPQQSGVRRGGGGAQAAAGAAQQQRPGAGQAAPQGQQQVPHMMSHFLPGLVLMQHPSPQNTGRADAFGVLGELFGQHQVRDPAVLFELFGDLEAVPRGVDPAVVEARTTTLTHEGVVASSEGAPQSQCCVCLEHFRRGEELRMLPCMHRYHRECIDRWLTRSPSCPVCKHDISR